ncbi:hypothetical protein POM88_039315 [Heracleum sosnowskyi]|uniref:DUF6598 domain-containing protein n=1 Tax=Heracleum sosnowskyi TaxID=360622 RepID=A0AAD8M8M6_9APIA|nr:hypothetical protein POM88_039315 [Heracleum sosnowskyi]
MAWGIALMEVFKIVYLGPDKLEPSKQLGTIKMSFDDKVLYLYKVDKIDPSRPTIEYMDDIPLEIKSPPVDFAHVDIEVDLFNGAYKGSINLDWEADDVSYQAESRESRIRSKHGLGEIVIVYGLFNNAAVANLEVKLLDCAADANVYGVVAACNSGLNSRACVSMLFAKKPGNKTQVGKHGLIPLSRSCLGVPMCSKLYVLISLHRDEVDYKAKLAFDAKTRGKDRECYEINYPQGNTDTPRIQVNVTWNVKQKAIQLLYDIPGILDDSDSDLSDDEEVN